MSIRNIAIAIGVGEANPLPYLGGAVNAAHAFHRWASDLGYESKLVTDEEEPVTLARLRSDIESQLRPEGGPIHRMLLYFAGHGLIREAEEGLWMLSDWNNELRAVAIEVLKRRLYMHDIQQIAVFSDSCRSLPSNITAADLCPDPVLGRGPLTNQIQPALDKFIAAQDGSAAYMVPGDNPSDDRCLFSGVLMEGLWGIKAEAFSKRVPGKVTSQSLGAFLRAEVPRIASIYSRQLVPSVSPTFPEEDDIYFAGPPPVPPTFVPWPLQSDVAARAQGMAPRQLEAEITPVASAAALIKKMRRQARPTHFETGAGFAVEGGSVRNIWTPPEVVAESGGQANWWRLRDRSKGWLGRPVPVLIEFDDGIFGAIAAMPRFIETILRDGPGMSALIYRPIDNAPTSDTIAEDAIGKMESGALRADNATDLAADLAAGLRDRKHFDPVLGVIAAYLYDSIGDVNNIRRMAFYYVATNQAIPYDIALLADLRGEWRDGMLWANVPAVSASRPRTETEESREWTYSKTSAESGPVGGLWPWMRQGWTFLDNPTEYESTLIHRGLIGLSTHLAPGRFTTFSEEGGNKLVKVVGLSTQR